MKPEEIARAAGLWDRGMNTAEIAAELALPEATIHNHLLAIRFWRKVA
ncbi:hypothetical protein [Prosthecomicrobium hirschii]|nr:hypothetical protein [Prosthecomicrobium hirschii]MCW1844166.1 hypothetical protein [Prosthecomicrobium hirschii]